MRRFLLIFAVILLQVPLFGQDISKHSETKRKIEEEITFINNQLKTLSGKQKASVAQLTLIQKKVADRRAILNSIDARIRALENQRVAKQREINRLQAELDTLVLYYDKLIYNTYRNRDTKVWFMYVLASENIGQGYRRMSYFRSLADEANRQGEKIKEYQKQLEQERAALQQLKEEQARIRAEREPEYKKLLAEEKRSKSDIKKLSKTEKQYRSDLAKKKKEVDRLNREIQKILNSTVAAQKKDKTVIDHALSEKFGQNKGKLPWPLTKGVITERFGVHYHPVYKNLKMPENNGITFSTEKNAKVFCVFDGIVRQIVVMPGYNQCVLVQHGEYFTFYCHLSKVNVRSGDKITRGACIGTLEADTKNGSSLHFQIWKGTAKQNPEKWLANM